MNEQPFFGFVVKEQYMLDADRKFIETAMEGNPNREKLPPVCSVTAGMAFQRSDFVTAGRRFNQAYLFAPGESGIYFAFAALAEARFKDDEFAEELFRVARTRPNPPKGLKRTTRPDIGGQLKRPKEAQPLLEQAVIDDPEFGMPGRFSPSRACRMETRRARVRRFLRGEAVSPPPSDKESMAPCGVRRLVLEGFGRDLAGAFAIGVPRASAALMKSEQRL